MQGTPKDLQQHRRKERLFKECQLSELTTRINVPHHHSRQATCIAGVVPIDRSVATKAANLNKIDIRRFKNPIDGGGRSERPAKISPIVLAKHDLGAR